MATPGNIMGMAGRVDRVRYESQGVKGNLDRAITELRSFWSSESANVFYEECEEVYHAFADSIYKLESIKDKLCTLAGVVTRAEAEQAAKREAERKAAELLLQMKKKQNYVKTNL